jgi:hypothetical protein
MKSVMPKADSKALSRPTRTRLLTAKVRVERTAGTGLLEHALGEIVGQPEADDHADQGPASHHRDRQGSSQNQADRKAGQGRSSGTQLLFSSARQDIRVESDGQGIGRRGTF